MGGKRDFSDVARMPARRTSGAQLPGYMLDDAQKSGRRLPRICADLPHASALVSRRQADGFALRGWATMVRLVKQAYSRFYAGHRASASVKADWPPMQAKTTRRNAFTNTQNSTILWKNPEWTRSNLG
jgi:hypothetical protein